MKTWIYSTELTLVWLFLSPTQTPAPDGLLSPEVHAGAHTWPVWRQSLTDFIPLLFREEL